MLLWGKLSFRKTIHIIMICCNGWEKELFKASSRAFSSKWPAQEENTIDRVALSMAVVERQKSIWPNLFLFSNQCKRWWKFDVHTTKSYDCESRLHWHIFTWIFLWLLFIQDDDTSFLSSSIETLVCWLVCKPFVQLRVITVIRWRLPMPPV